MSLSLHTIGHQRQLAQLEREMRQKKLSHAYLFTGPAHVGKFHVARLMAAALLCPEGGCGECRACVQMEKGIHPDRILLEDQGESLKIDDIRRLVSQTSMTSQGSRRVVLIQNIERMPTEAQNAFLKTLEEPAGETLFLLTSSQPSQVLGTIASRSRLYEFFPLPAADFLSELEKRLASANQERLGQAAAWAQGRAGLAIRLMHDEELFSSYQQMLGQIEQFLAKNDLIGKFRFAETLEGSPEQMEIFMDVFFQKLRHLAEEYLLDPSHPFGKRFSLRNIHDLFENLTETGYLVHKNVNKKLALQQLLMQTEK